MGVSIFFIISGYGLACSIKKNSPISISYFLNHLVKFLKPFLFIWILDTLFFHQSLFDSIVNLFSLSISNNRIWFLKEIFVLYLFTLLPNLFSFSRNRFIIPLILTTSFTLLLSLSRLEHFWWNATLCFPLGVICSLYKEKLDLIFNKHKYLFCLLFGFAFFLFFGLSYFYNYKGFEIIRTLFFAMCAISIVSLRQHKIKFFDVLMDSCSKESLKIYIFHVFLLQFCGQLNCISFCLLIIFGTIFLIIAYNFINKHLGLLIDRISH